MREKHYYVYIVASKSRALYVGMTAFLMTRIFQHRRGECDYTARYRINRLVYFESFQYVNSAIARETQIKSWRRSKKVALVEHDNPTWEDLAAEWGKPNNSRFLARASTVQSARARNDRTYIHLLL